MQRSSILLRFSLFGLFSLLFFLLPVCCVGGGYGLVKYDQLYADATSVTVMGHSWSRSITIEGYGDYQTRVCHSSPGHRKPSSSTCHQEHHTGWHEVRKVTSTGDGLARQWPQVSLTQTCTTAEDGCEREGAHTEQLTLHLRLPDGSNQNCSDVVESLWLQATDGGNVVLPLGALSGWPWCRDLRVDGQR